MSEFRINMPQMDAAGLSENWLFRQAGECHWDALCRGLGCASHEIQDELGVRLYPTFVAIRARYIRPLNSVRENDRLACEVGIAHYGRAFVASRVTLSGQGGRFELEMLTTFAARLREGANALARTLPAHDFAGLDALSEPPALLAEARALRASPNAAHLFAGHAAPDEGGGWTTSYEPSPYSDFNGAKLLYFAAYPTIADTCERRLLIEHVGVDGRRWALDTSTLARDVFYHGNLDLGARVTLRLAAWRQLEGAHLLRSVLCDAADGRRLADVFTLKVESGKAGTHQSRDRYGSLTDAELP